MQKIPELIIYTTDLGHQYDSSRLQIRAFKLGFRGQFIQNHQVTRHSIIEGAFMLDGQAKDCLPGSSVHVAVVDPGVGSERKGIIIQTGTSFLVGPDNGVLYPTSVREEIQSAWQIDEKKINGRVSVTFHGRDVFTPAAVYLTQGKEPESFGCTRIDPRSLASLTFERGQVGTVDEFGNVKILGYENPQTDLRLSFGFNGQHVEVPFRRTFSDVPLGAPVAYWGSDDTLELGVNQGKAHLLFGDEPDYVIKPGHILDIQKL